MSTAELKFVRQPEDATADDELKAWAVELHAGETVDPLGRLVQPKENKRDWQLIRGEQSETVGETKLDAIRRVKSMFAELIPAPQPKPRDPDQTVEQIEARIAELEKEIESFAGKPEFAKAASVRKGQITRLRKQLPTNAPHAV